MSLNEKQKQFCEEFIIDFNATQAAIRAGYSKNTARNIASENLARNTLSSSLKNVMSELKSRRMKLLPILLKLCKGACRLSL